MRFKALNLPIRTTNYGIFCAVPGCPDEEILDHGGRSVTISQLTVAVGLHVSDNHT